MAYVVSERTSDIADGTGKRIAKYLATFPLFYCQPESDCRSIRRADILHGGKQSRLGEPGWR